MEFELIELVNQSPLDDVQTHQSTPRLWDYFLLNKADTLQGCVQIALCWVICSYGFLVKSYWLLHFLVVL